MDGQTFYKPIKVAGRKIDTLTFLKIVNDLGPLANDIIANYIIKTEVPSITQEEAVQVLLANQEFMQRFAELAKIQLPSRKLLDVGQGMRSTPSGRRTGSSSNVWSNIGTVLNSLVGVVGSIFGGGGNGSGGAEQSSSFLDLFLLMQQSQQEQQQQQQRMLQQIMLFGGGFLVVAVILFLVLKPARD